MNFIFNLIPDELIRAIGWTIFHSLWQGGAIAILLGGILLIPSTKSARLRYNLSLIALFLMFCISVITFIKVYEWDTQNKFEKAVMTPASSETSQAAQEYSSLSANTNPDLIYMLKSNFEKYLPLVVTVWLFGFIIFSFRFVGGVFYVQRLKSVGIKPLDDFWSYVLKDISTKIELKKFVQIFESTKVKVPVAIGYMKPIILLPLGMIAGLPQDQVEAIIAHELAHIKRNDFLINLLQTFVETILFYHPAVWWISSIIKNERESCCDDLTLKVCGGSLTYFKALINLQQICSKESEFALAAIGRKNQLFRRINRMNSNNGNTSYGGKFAAFAVLLIMIAAASIFSTSSAKELTPTCLAASFVNPLNTIGENFSLAASSNEILNVSDTVSIKKGTRTLKFNDADKRYKAKLNNGKLEELYIDGEKVPEKDLQKYEAMVSQRVEEYDSAMKEFRNNMKDYKAKMKAFKEKMKKFRGNNDYAFDFEMPVIPPIDFDTTINVRIEKELEKNLNENFAKHSFTIPPIPKIHIPPIKIPHINIPPLDWDSLKADTNCYSFNNEEFKKSMKEWGTKFKKELENWKFDNEKFKAEMEKFKEEMKKSGPNSEAFKKSMGELKKNMGKLKADMKILKEFTNEAKDEMINDKLIERNNDLDSFTLSKDELIVNGKKTTPELHKKYLELYKKHYGKELKGDEKFRWND